VVQKTKKAVNYKVKYMCSNCIKVKEISIQKGTTVKQYVKGKKCEYCGCSL